MQLDNRENIGLDEENQRFDIVGFDQGLRLEELNDHIVFVKQLVASKTPEDLSERLLNIFNNFGFSDFSFIGCTHNYKPHIFLTTLPEKLLADYQAQQFYRHDMTLDYLNADNPTHFHHSDIQQIIDSAGFLTQTFGQNRKILALYKKFGFNDAYLMPYKPSKEEIDGKETKRKDTDNKSNLLFSLMAKGATAEEFLALTESRGAVLHLLGDTAIRVYQSKFTSYNPAPRINSKSIRLLNIMAKSDLSLSQAADKLCVSTDTANKYMAAAKKMLGSRSQANTVYRAIQKGFIDLD